MTANMEQITAAIQAELSGTPFECTSLITLSGGNANFVFHGRLKTPLSSSSSTKTGSNSNNHSNKPNNESLPAEAENQESAKEAETASTVTEILIKHGEPYVRSNTSFPLPTSRCEVEATTLSILATHLSPVSSSPPFTVRTPKLHHFNPQTNTQIQEYLPSGPGIDLKTYALKHFESEPSTSPTKRPQCLSLGHSLGTWLHEFHTWTGSSSSTSHSPTQQLKSIQTLHETAKRNKPLQLLKNATYYEYLSQKMTTLFPSILDDDQTRSLFAKLEVIAAQELENDDTLQVVHGDFWTGNILLPDRDFPTNPQVTVDVPVDVFVVDWEVTTLGMPLRDIGQMIAELYMLVLFRNITAGEWIIEGFLAGYGKLTTVKDAFRTLIHIGAHLVVIGGTVAGWADKEKDEKAERERVVAFGRDMIVKGWEEDRSWFENHCPVLTSGLFGHD